MPPFFGVLCWLALTTALPANADESDQADPLLLSEDVLQLTEAGINFQFGRGVAQNIRRAIQLLCTAARLDHGPAQYELGWLYLNRRHGRRDDDQAASWLKQAADQGDRHAERLLGHISAAPAGQARCPLPDGSNYQLPLKSKPAPSTKEIRYWVRRLAPEYHLPPELVLEVIRAESNFDVRAHSHADARGLMQLIPRTARRFGVKDIWDPLQNIRGGMAYLRWLLDYYDGNLRLALAGYNAGEEAVDSYKGVPPYQETRRYVRLITQKLKPDLRL